MEVTSTDENVAKIKLMQEMGKKAEQQSLAKYGLDFVTDTYLPEKLDAIGLGYR